MRWLAIMGLMFLLSVSTAHATKTLQVEKYVDKQDIKVGDDVKVLLKFRNPFGKDIPVRIVDKNVFGNNGIDVQCLEYNIPAQEETVFGYDPIKPFSPGKYTLEPAEVTYMNPETGKEETVKSNALEIEVKGQAQQGQAQGITTIYRCNGVSMQSTSYSSSGSSFSIQIGSSGMQQFQMPHQTPQTSPQSRVQNNQLNQNTNALKKEMERQLEEQRRMREEFQQNLAQNPEFQKRHQELLKRGYELKNASLNPMTNNTGIFELSYQKPNGETAIMKGEMRNGKIKELMTFTAEAVSYTHLTLPTKA